MTLLSDVSPVQYKRAFIALGSNQSSVAGGPIETVRYALQLLEDVGFHLVAVSPLYSTYAVPVGSGPDFINAVVEVSTPLDSSQTLALLHGIEAEMGRTRAQRWAPRPLDLDLLAVEGFVLPDAQTHDHWRRLAPDRQKTVAPDGLVLPHPRLQDRAFVLVPWADIAPDWQHPVLHKTVREMLNDLPDADKEGVNPAE